MNLSPRLVGSFGWLVFVAMLSTIDVRADAPLEGSSPAHWRVTWSSDPAHHAIVSWSTAKQAKKYQLQYWPKADPRDKSTLAAESGRYIGGEAELYFYHARLNQLQPSTAYAIQIFSDEHQSPIMYFVTAPIDDRPFSILVGGDSRTDREERRRVNQLMSDLVSRSVSNDSPADDIIALAHGGDYITSGTNLEQWSNWMSDHELTACPDGRLLPVIPTRGNHDRGKIYNPLFGFPDDDQNYFAINLGAKVRLITLNTEISTAGDQASWLANELEESRPRNRWLLAQFHRPVYPSVKAPSSALQSWVPLFEKYNVDLVCEQDGHTIKRTVPIRDNARDETGVVYIGEGGLGVEQRTPKSERWYLQPPGMTSAGSHVFIVNFAEAQLTGRCQRLDGGIADEFVLKPRELKTAK